MNAAELLNSPEDLNDAIVYTSPKTGIEKNMVEKDIWVTFLLGYLFRDSPWKDSILFKGGTCLSKCYGTVERFSEDIDILLDWRVLGYDLEGPPIEPSRKKQENSNDALVARLQEFIENEFIPTLREDISEIIDRPFEVVSDKRNVLFRYPSLFGSDLIEKHVLIEIGPRGRWGKPTSRTVRSYMCQHIPGLDDETTVRCIPMEQAYYEKIQIIHSLTSRGKVPPKNSRHYYDVYRIHKALGHIDYDAEAMASDVEYSRRFYPGAGYGYDEMARGSYRLMPTEDMMPSLVSDYRSMSAMIFGDKPSLDDILSELAAIEKELNRDD